jgi:hypothetical protein
MMRFPSHTIDNAVQIQSRKSTYGSTRSRTPLSTALPLYLNPVQSMLQKKSHGIKYSSSLYYRSDANSDEDISAIVESVYKTNYVMKDERQGGPKSYLLLIGVEEQKQASDTYHPPLKRQCSSSMTLMSREGMLERHRAENGFEPYFKPTSSISETVVVRPTDKQSPLQKQLDRRTTESDFMYQPQRISFFDGGEPFLTFSNLEYDVTVDEIRDAMNTGFCVAFVATMMTLHPFDMDHYYFAEDLLNDMKFAMWLSVSIPTITAYLSITRSTLGALTRTVSTNNMNLLRLLHVISSFAIHGSCDSKDILKIKSTSTATRVDNGVASVTSKPTNFVHYKTQGATDQADPLPSIPTLMGEWVWYSSKTIFQHTKNAFTETVKSMEDYQVAIIRSNRLQVQERRQRHLLQAQIFYTT